MQRIVIGVDGSANAQVALRWAVEEAERHDATVVAVLAWSYLDQRHAGPDEAFDSSYGEEQARDALRASLQAVGGSRPVEQRVVCDLPARALLDAGREADLLVVGARGLGGFKGLLLGSVSERVLEQSTCPVAVVRTEDAQPDGGPVAVGIDGSETSRRALRWAAREAEARSVPLRVVHAWQLPAMAGPAGEEVGHAIEEGARSVLDEALADPSLTGLEIDPRLVHRGTARGLLESSADASVVVVGTRGLGRLGRVLLGSTSRQLVHHAPCPTVVVPTADHG